MIRTRTAARRIVSARRRRGALIVVGALGGAALASTARADDPPQPAEQAKTARFALVIGSNATSSKEQKPLAYADDDAARVAEVLEQSGVKTVLLTSFDKESQARFSDRVAGTKAPNRREVKKAYGELVKQMQSAKDAGSDVEFTIYYSGHGDVGPDGRGFLTLDGGRLTRADLFGDFLTRSPADFNHILIDACRSEQFVLSKGNKNHKSDRVESSRRTEDVAQYLETQHLGAYPNTGVVLASSADQQTHEWGRYQGGVFTHQLLSGLRGAADINGDGSIEYSELGAFVSAANSGVKDSRAKLEVIVRPPERSQRHPVLVHENVAQQRVLYFSERDDNHYVVEDDRGVRLADVRRDGTRAGYVRLPPTGPVYVVRNDAKDEGSTEALIPSDERGLVLASNLHYENERPVARGSLDAAFRAGLFAVPYGPGYYSGYTDRQNMLGVADPDWEVQVWERGDDGEMHQVETVRGNDVPEGPTVREDGVIYRCSDSQGRRVVVYDEDGDREVEVVDCNSDLVETIDEVTTDVSWRPWAGISAGIIFTPLAPEGKIGLGPDRMTSNQFAGWGQDTGFGRSIRGVDVRGWLFEGKDGRDFPRAEGYFRTGVTQGQADFRPVQGENELAHDDPSRLSYLSVPIFLGGNIYLFRRFPVRPYAGAGFGLDVLYLRYQYANNNPMLEAVPDRTDLSLRVGFELHAGIEARITNYLSFSAEAQQLWSARRRIGGLPDFSNEGITLVGSVRVAFPTGPKRTRTKTKRTMRRVETVETRTVVPPPAPPAPPEPGPAAPPASGGSAEELERAAEELEEAAEDLEDAADELEQAAEELQEE